MKKRRERKAGKGGRETAVSGRNGRHGEEKPIILTLAVIIH
jgi:hypothetical protein